MTFRTRSLFDEEQLKSEVQHYAGTLADTMPAHYQAWMATLTPLGATFTEEQFYAMGGWPTQRVAEWVVREHRVAVTADVITDGIRF